MNPILIGLIALLVGAAIGWVVHHLKSQADAKSAGAVVSNARKEAEAIVRDATVRTQESLLKSREEFDAEAKVRRQELTDAEKRLLQRENNLDRKVDWFDRKTEEFTKKEEIIVAREKELHKIQGELDELKRLSQIELQRVASLSVEQAKVMLLARVEDEVRAEAGTLTRRLIEDARLNADREAQRVITIAVERCASNHVQGSTSSTVALPNEDMKGRIIGREGRNIRAFEAATGVNVVNDDTPQAVALSGFDPVRREVAKQTLERLIADGRINPARIEEEVAKVTSELDETMRKAGEEAVYKLGLQKVHPEVIKLLGRLKFRHSFAQNVLDHSVEVAEI